MIVMPAGPLLAWKRGDAFAVAQRLTFAAGFAVLCAAAVLIVAGGGSVLAATGLIVGLFALAGAIVEIAERIALFREPFSHSMARAKGTPRAAYGSALAHAGMGIALLGVVAESGWSEERIVALKPGERVSIARFELGFIGLGERSGPNWQETSGGSKFASAAMSSDDAAGEARLCGVRPADDRSGDQHLRSRPALSQPRRSRAGRRDFRAHLLEAVRAADLVRPGTDGARRLAVALRPPPQSRRAAAGAAHRSGSGGVAAIVPRTEARAGTHEHGAGNLALPAFAGTTEIAARLFFARLHCLPSPCSPTKC
jgi:hypothetical protein